MKNLVILIASSLLATSVNASSIEAKTDAGTYAISVVLSCTLIKERGYTGESLKKGLVEQTHMDEESAANLANNAAAWVARNPGKDCQQLYVNMIDKYYSESNQK